jgi:hypothetical protein
MRAFAGRRGGEEGTVWYVLRHQPVGARYLLPGQAGTAASKVNAVACRQRNGVVDLRSGEDKLQRKFSGQGVGPGLGALLTRRSCPHMVR